MTNTNESGIKVPVHLAIIPDGNRRWAKSKGLPTLEGHRKGAENFEELLNAARSIGIKYFSSWAFSTENWKRSEDEVNYLFKIARDFTKRYSEKFLKEKSRFIHLGRKDRLPQDIVETLVDMEEKTKDFTDFTVCMGMDYGGQDELRRAFIKIKEQNLEISPENITNNLDTRGIIPNLDLLIRTGGEQRTSGFMPWQSVYAEFYFVDLFFPDFDSKQLKLAVENYSQRERRFGGNSNNATNK